MEISYGKKYGSAYSEKAYSIIQTTDAGFAICGEKKFAENDSDFWVLKLDKKGEVQWSRTVGKSNFDRATKIFQMEDGSFTVSGNITSQEYNQKDFWVFNLNKSGIPEWDKSFGGFGSYTATSIFHTADDGFAICGITQQYLNEEFNFWLLKVNNKGKYIYSKEFGGIGKNKVDFILQSKNKEFILIGTTKEKGYTKKDLWILSCKK